MQNTFAAVALDKGQVSNDTKVDDSKHSNSQMEVIALSSNLVEEKEEDGSGQSGVIVPTSSIAINAAATLQALASQILNMTAPEAIAHIQQVLHVPYDVVFSLVSELANEAIVIAQATLNTTEAMKSVQNTTEAMKSAENTTEAMVSIKNKLTNDSAEETFNIEKTKSKSQVPESHKCFKCNKVFCTNSTLSRHLQHHISEIKCTQCNKVYFSPIKLAAHIKVHQTVKVKDTICPECGKGFYNHAQLKVHLRTHTGERPFQCTFCEKKFLCISRQKCHERLHTGVYPFTCDTCGKGFGSPSKLKDHTYIHTNKTPYLCNICGKGFSQWATMVRHISSIHEKKAGVKCPVCTKSFTKYYLKIHMQKCHWMECPNCKDFFESYEAFEKHETVCSGFSSTALKSNGRFSAKHKLSSPSSPVVPCVSLRKSSNPIYIDHLMSFYEGDPLSYPNYEGVEGEEEELVEEVLEEGEEEKGVVDKFEEGERVGMDQEDILVQEVQEQILNKIYE